MARHKTAHRKTLEAQFKSRKALRDKVVAELAAGDTLKANAASNAKSLARRSATKPSAAPKK